MCGEFAIALAVSSGLEQSRRRVLYQRRAIARGRFLIAAVQFLRTDIGARESVL
jgi:hypothetical protein